MTDKPKIVALIERMREAEEERRIGSLDPYDFLDEIIPVLTSLEMDEALAELTAPREPMSEDVADQGCRVPPDGWRCSRPRGHEGPCAARETDKPVGAGWSRVPETDADHSERLSPDELAKLGAGVSEWAYNHLARGYAVSLTVREVKRLIARLTTPYPGKSEPDTPAPARYRHKKRGTLYDIVGTAELQAEQPQAEHAKLVIYRGDDGKLWARNSAEFHDGRFERYYVANAPRRRWLSALVVAGAIALPGLFLWE